jgi:hypothetical protein
MDLVAQTMKLFILNFNYTTKSRENQESVIANRAILILGAGVETKINRVLFMVVGFLFRIKSAADVGVNRKTLQIQGSFYS